MGGYMFKLMAISYAMAAIFSDYPAFLKRGGVIEAYTDRGAIVELIVRCKVGSGIISYSKADKKYCSSKMHCSTSRDAAITDTCNN
jgi:hypothetical protein